MGVGSYVRAVFAMADRSSPSWWAPLVGREAELARLDMAVNETVAGQGGLVLVSGEPGIGKTRLVEEVAARAAQAGALVAWGRIDEAEGSPPYWPWVQLLRAVLSRAESYSVLAALESTAATIAQILPEVSDLVKHVPAQRAPTDPSQARFLLHQGIVDFLDQTARRQPLVAIVDDLHWADVASLELAGFIGLRLSAAPILLVLTYRSIGGGRSEALDELLGALARQPTLARFALTGLTEDEVRRFIAQMIDVEPNAQSVAAVHARTDGNPFFVGEMARLLSREGLVFEHLTRPDPLSGPVPTGVRDVIRRRLALLPTDTSELLAIGAVIGRDFDLAVLAAAAQLTEAQSLERIEPAVAEGVVCEAAGPRVAFRFTHSLQRDAIYDELSVLRRATIHARVGATLERRPNPRQRLTELAMHYFHGAAVAGPERGVTYALEAAADAQGALAYEQAEDHLLRAVALIEFLPPGRHRLQREVLVQNRLAMLLTMTRGFSAADTSAAWTRSSQLCTELGASPDLLMPLFGQFVAHCTRGDHRTAAAIGQQMVALGKAVVDTALILAGHDVLGMTSLYRGHLAEAKSHLEQSRILAATIDQTNLLQIFPMHAASVAVELAIVYYLLGDEESCDTLRAEAVAIRDHLHDPLAIGPSLILDLQLHGCRSTSDTFPDAATQVAEQCRTWGLIELATTADIWASSALQERDGRDRTGELTERLAALDSAGFRIWRTQHLAILAACYRRSGNLDHALRLVNEGLEEALRNDERYWEPELLRLRGEILEAFDPPRTVEAVNSIKQAIALAHSQGSTTLQQHAEKSLAIQHTQRASSDTELAPRDEAFTLTSREQELLLLVGKGLTDKEIAAAMVISIATVRSHLERIRKKTGRRRRLELIRLTDDLGITSA